MTPAEWAGVGLYAAAMTLCAICLGTWRYIGPVYALFLLIESLAFGALGAGIALKRVPLSDQQMLVVGAVLGAVIIWHVVAILFWPAAGSRPRSR